MRSKILEDLKEKGLEQETEKLKTEKIRNI